MRKIRGNGEIIMICEKCGRVLAENESSCPDCGAAVPEKTEKGARLKISKRAKIIIASVAAAAVTAVLVAFVLIPLIMPQADVSKYISVTFDSDPQYEGNIRGTITINRQDVIDRYLEDEPQSMSVNGAVDRLLYYATINYSDADGKKTGSGRNSVKFGDISKDDVLTVEITWPEEEKEKAIIAREEKALGITINKSPKTFEVKIADYLKDQGIELKDPVEIDITDYIRDNDLIFTFKDEGGLRAGVKVFENKIGEYTLKSGNNYFPAIRIYDKAGKYFSSIYLEFSKSSDLVAGEKITLDYSADNSDAIKNGILLTGEPVEYTVTQPEEPDPGKN